EQFEKYDWMPALAQSLSIERAAGITTIDWIEKQNSGKRFNAIGGTEGQENAGNSGSVAVNLMPRGWWELEKVNYARIIETLMANAERASKPGAAGSIDQLD